MADNGSKIILLVSDGKPGGVTEMHFESKEDGKLGDRAKQQGLNVSNYEIREEKRRSKGKAKK